MAPSSTPVDSAASALLSAAPEPDQRWQEHWLQRWYAVAVLQDLDPAAPWRFTLLEQDLVLWFDRAAGQWRAFADACPHRLVPLSEGRLNAAGDLECPYHGWSFNGEGQCTAIPQASPEAAAAACASATLAACGASKATASGRTCVARRSGSRNGSSTTSRCPFRWSSERSTRSPPANGTW